MSADPGAEQPGLAVTVSPDSGNGGRMSFLRLRDTPTGLAIDFIDVPSADTTTGLPRASRSRRGSIERFRTPSGSRWTSSPALTTTSSRSTSTAQLKVTGSSWENYYRNDSENGPGQPVPVVDQLLLRVSSAAQPANAGKGFLIDDVSPRSYGGLGGAIGPAGPDGPAGSNGQTAVATGRPARPALRGRPARPARRHRIPRRLASTSWGRG